MLSPGRMRLLSSCHSSGRWFFGSHWPLASRSEKIRSFARDRSSSRRAPPNAASKPPAGSASSSDLVLSAPQHALRADQKRLRAVGDRFGVGVDDEPRADLGGVAVAELDHLAELVGRVDVQQRERDRAGIKRLLRQPQQDRRVLADRVQHHRPLELGDHLAHDVDGSRPRARAGASSLAVSTPSVAGVSGSIATAIRVHHVRSSFVVRRRSPRWSRRKNKKARVSPGFRSRVLTCVGWRMFVSEPARP